MDRQAQRAFAVGAGAQLAVMLAATALLAGDRLELVLSLAGLVAGTTAAVSLVRDGAARAWEDAAFYGGGAAAVGTIAYVAVESSYTVAVIWFDQGVFAPVDVFLVRYLFGIWLIIIGLLVGIAAGVVGYVVAGAVLRRIDLGEPDNI